MIYWKLHLRRAHPHNSLKLIRMAGVPHRAEDSMFARILGRTEFHLAANRMHYGLWFGVRVVCFFFFEKNCLWWNVVKAINHKFSISKRNENIEENCIGTHPLGCRMCRVCCPPSNTLHEINLRHRFWPSKTYDVYYAVFACRTRPSDAREQQPAAASSSTRQSNASSVGCLWSVQPNNMHLSVARCRNSATYAWISFLTCISFPFLLWCENEIIHVSCATQQ